MIRHFPVTLLAAIGTAALADGRTFILQCVFWIVYFVASMLCLLHHEAYE